MNYLKLTSRATEDSIGEDMLRDSRVKSKQPALTTPTPPFSAHCREKGFLSEWKGTTMDTIQTPEERKQATSS